MLPRLPDQRGIIQHPFCFSLRQQTPYTLVTLNEGGGVQGIRLWTTRKRATRQQPRVSERATLLEDTKTRHRRLIFCMRKTAWGNPLAIAFVRRVLAFVSRFLAARRTRYTTLFVDGLALRELEVLPGHPWWRRPASGKRGRARP